MKYLYKFFIFFICALCFHTHSFENLFEEDTKVWVEVISDPVELNLYRSGLKIDEKSWMRVLVEKNITVQGSTILIQF